jgi:hypothetical protein
VKKGGHIYTKVLFIIVLINMACTCRLFADTHPYLSISYLGAGYAFQLSHQDEGVNIMLSDTDIDDDADQLNDLGRSLNITWLPSVGVYAFCIHAKPDANVLLPYCPSQKDIDLKRALPLRI